LGRARLALLTAPVAAAVLAGAAGLLARDLPWVGLAAAAAAAVLCVAHWTVTQGHHEGLRRLGDMLGGLAADPGRVPPGEPPDGAGAEAAAIHAAAVRLQAARAAERRERTAGGIAGRLGQILGSLPQGILVLTDTGLVTLANGSARRRFGDGALLPGTSVFDALARDDVGRAMAAARQAGRPVAATVATLHGHRLAVQVTALGAVDGAVFTFAADEAWQADLDHALELHDRPPPPPAVDATTPLAGLPVAVLDTETTGLDPAADRVVSVGAVRMHGERLFRGATIDRLVRPGVAIPARASAVHGIDDAMVADAPPLAAVLPALAEFIEGCVVVGHNIGFDLAVLEAECARAGMAWRRPASLCLFQLADALDPGRTDVDLDGLAHRLGLVPTGRHTALGDALLSAEVYQGLLPRLAALGVADWGSLQRLAAGSRRARRLQAGAGW
jgi:DNA polymerase-3 subunit epsilon